MKKEYSRPLTEWEEKNCIEEIDDSLTLSETSTSDVIKKWSDKIFDQLLIECKELVEKGEEDLSAVRLNEDEFSSEDYVFELAEEIMNSYLNGSKTMNGEVNEEKLQEWCAKKAALLADKIFMDIRFKVVDHLYNEEELQ